MTERNVLFINYEFPPLGGGGANACREILSRWAKRKDLHIELVTSSPDNRFQVEDFSENIRITKVNVKKKNIHYWTQMEVLRFILEGGRAVKNLLSEKQFDLAHAFFGFPSGFIAYQNQKKLPYVVSLRGSDVPGFNPRFNLQYIFLRPLFKKIWSRADEVVVNSQGLRDLARQTLELDYRIIRNGVDSKFFTPPETKDKKSSVMILAIGRLIRRKGYHFLLQALETLKDLDWRVKIVGKGNQEEELKKLAQNLGIADRVEFCSYVPHEQLRSIYQQADIFVQPSFFEGMSNTVLEAMASGLPLVVTKTGGTDELFRGNGKVVKFGSPEEISGALKKLIADDQFRTQSGVKSREIAEEMDWDRVAQDYLKIYDQVIA